MGLLALRRWRYAKEPDHGVRGIVEEIDAGQEQVIEELHKGSDEQRRPLGIGDGHTFGASSPKTTCKKVIVPKAVAKAMTRTLPSGTPSGSKSGSRRWAKAGSPIHPSPSEEIVMPSWHTER